MGVAMLSIILFHQYQWKDRIIYKLGLSKTK